MRRICQSDFRPIAVNIVEGSSSIAGAHGRRIPLPLGAEATAPVVVAAAALSAALLWLAGASGPLGWLAWVALVPVAAITLGGPPTPLRRLAVPLAYALHLELLLVPALPFGIADGEWGEPPLPVLVGDSPVLLAALVAVPALTALLWALRFGQPWPILGAIAGPAAAWTALELVRVKLDPAGIWGPLFTSQRATAPGDLGALAGPYALTFAIVAANYALALAIVGRGRARPAGAAVAVVLVAGAALLPPGGASSDRQVTVAAIQPGYDTAEDGHPVLRFFKPSTYRLASLDLIRDLGKLTRAAADRGARLVVWPEAAVWADPREPGSIGGALEQLARETGATLVVPYFVPERAQGATIVVEPGAGLGRSQPKQRPMWFIGEDGGNKTPPRPAPAAGERIGTMNGVDNQDPGLAATLARRGASVLTSSTHDWKQLAGAQRPLSRFHARATGVDGRPLAGAGRALRRTVVTATVRPAEGPRLAAHVGDVPGWLAVVATGLALATAAMARLRRRGRRAGRGTEV
jgi:apolipoprotein N-acyltransferase